MTKRPQNRIFTVENTIIIIIQIVKKVFTLLELVYYTVKHYIRLISVCFPDLMLDSFR